MGKKSLFAIACSIIFAVFIGINGVLFSLNEFPKTFFEKTGEFFSWESIRTKYIDLYGIAQNVLGKKQIENFTIIKNAYGRLVSPRNDLSDADIEAKFDAVKPVFDFLREMDIPFIYLRGILPISSEEDLPIGVHDASHQNFERLGKILSEQKIPVFDLNIALSEKITKENLFYKTDHHWSGDASFAAYCAVGQLLEKESVIKPSVFTDDTFFERLTIPNSFLGSYGIKVGKYYAGKDDYMYYRPLADTDIELIAYREDGSLLTTKRGKWERAVMDCDLLDDSGYNNKYDGFLFANSGENILINHRCEETKKLLVIAHSYGRGMVPYFSLLFSEVRWIDPQPGRFMRNYIAYINEYQPDYVIFLNEFEGEIIGEYRVN